MANEVTKTEAGACRALQFALKCLPEDELETYCREYIHALCVVASNDFSASVVSMKPSDIPESANIGCALPDWEYGVTGRYEKARSSLVKAFSLADAITSYRRSGRIDDTIHGNLGFGLTVEASLTSLTGDLYEQMFIEAVTEE